MNKKPVTIEMVSSKNCDRCVKMEQRILAVAKKAGVQVVVEKVDCSTSTAVALGVTYGLDDIPSFVVGGLGFSGEAFTDTALEAVLKQEGGR